MLTLCHMVMPTKALAMNRYNAYYTSTPSLPPPQPPPTSTELQVIRVNLEQRAVRQDHSTLIREVRETVNQLEEVRQLAVEAAQTQTSNLQRSIETTQLLNKVNIMYDELRIVKNEIEGLRSFKKEMTDFKAWLKGEG